MLKGSACSCAAFIASLQAPSHVEILRVIFVDETISEMAPSFAHTVRSAFGDQLRILRLKSDSMTPFPSTVLPPLFSCRKLESVRIPIDRGADGSLSDLKAQARRAWPNIVSLRLRR